MTAARALVHGPARPLPASEVQVDDVVFCRAMDGTLARHPVSAAATTRGPTVHVRSRGRNAILGADQRVLRVLKPSRTRKFTAPCEEGGCDRIAGTRGRCTPCYQRLYKTGSLPETWGRPPRFATELVPARELQRGDLMVVLDYEPDEAPPAVTIEDGGMFGIPVTAEMAWLFGAIVGDGTVSETDIRVAAFGDFATEVTEAIRTVFGLNAIPHWSAGLIAPSVSAATFLRGLGFWRRGEDKRVPEVVWSWPIALQQNFCRGYAAADGYFGRDGQSYASCSRRLLDEVRTLHIRAGHRVTNVTTNMRKKPIFINGKLVKNAKPLHNFVVSSLEGEPYAAIPTPIVEAMTGGAFGVRVVLGVDDAGIQDQFRIEVDGADNVVIDGVPTWVPSVELPALQLRAA